MQRGIWTIVVAGGSAQRFGAPKQFESLGTARVIDQAIATARRHSEGVVVVVPTAFLDDAAVGSAADAVVEGGPTRSESVRRGLSRVPTDASVVLVHDAARPAADDALFSRVVDAVVTGAAVAVPTIDVVDTIRHRDGGVVDRADLLVVQTPQGFRAQALRAAHDLGDDATDDAALVERNGGTVVHVAGDRRNIKITEPADLDIVAASMGFGASSTGSADASLSSTRSGSSGKAGGSVGLRVGNGFDIHRFTDDPDRVLVLGGVTFTGERGLVGNSDADVVAHACAEALLGAVGLGDLGSHFPDTDDRWTGADSMVLLAEVVRMVEAEGMRAVNLDCSVIAESPKLAPRRLEMQAALSAVVGAPVSVKGRRAEGIGGLGRREGIAAMVTALLTDIN